MSTDCIHEECRYSFECTLLYHGRPNYPVPAIITDVWFYPYWPSRVIIVESKTVEPYRWQAVKWWNNVYQG